MGIYEERNSFMSRSFMGSVFGLVITFPLCGYMRLLEIKVYTLILYLMLGPFDLLVEYKSVIWALRIEAGGI